MFVDFTNDLHCLAFRPKIDLSLLEGRTGTEEPEVEEQHDDS